MADMIENYGLVGNLHTAALVSNTGSADWFCAPRFDSDACFSALVGYERSMIPAAAVKSETFCKRFRIWP